MIQRISPRDALSKSYNHSPSYRFPAEIGTAHVCSGLKVAIA